MGETRGAAPTYLDFAKLPCWAQIAMAARGARRAFSCVTEWPIASETHRRAAVKAIEYAEGAARAAMSGLLDADIKRSAETASTRTADLSSSACSAARAAFLAASAALSADGHASRSQNAAASLDAFESVLAACSALADTKPIWDDYDRLLALAISEGWNDTSYVDVNRLGPL